MILLNSVANKHVKGIVRDPFEACFQSDHRGEHEKKRPAERGF